MDDSQLSAANREVMHRYPGEPHGRQQVHTVYGGAQIFRHDTASRLGAVALRAMDAYAADPRVFEQLLGLPTEIAADVHMRVAAKLRAEPVEDFRIDFEDGYGNRPDAEEDGHAASTAREVARGMAEGTLPPHIGIRVKPLTEELRARSVRTLEIFIKTLVEETGGALPPNFVVTLPKVTIPAQAAYFAALLADLEIRLALPERSLVFEFMVETPQIIFGPDGRATLPLVLDACAGRAVAAHFGTYDYTASCQITAAYQHMQHPSCDFARHMMQVSLAGIGLMLSDGSTTTLPVPPHGAPEGGELTGAQRRENADVMHHAWKRHYDDVRDSLMRGFYQGWDLHPAQMVTRYAAVFSFFLEGLDAAGARLHNFIGKAAQATLVGAVFDDAATGQGLLNYFLRGINSGAVTEDETAARTGLTIDELRTRSFVAILKGRRGEGSS